MNTIQLELISPTPKQYQENITNKVEFNDKISHIKILVSALSASVKLENQSELIKTLCVYPESIEIARSLGNSRLVRELRIQSQSSNSKIALEGLTLQKNQVFYKNQDIGKIQFFYKSPSPGELQAKLSYESIIERFLNYLQKQNKIIVLHESNYHVQVFIPKTEQIDNINLFWNEFIEKIAFSQYGNSAQELFGLLQTFILILKEVTLADRGFSTLEIPIITKDQAIILAALYMAVFEQVRDRQFKRQFEITQLKLEIENQDLTEKEKISKEKLLIQKQEMQNKESKKYCEYFQKSFLKKLEEQQECSNKIKSIETQLNQTGLKKSQINKLQETKAKLESQIIFDQDSLISKWEMLEAVKGDPFEFLRLDIQKNPSKFKDTLQFSKSFNKKATEQINSTRGDIFTQCILEMYRLLEIKKFDPIPESLLQTNPHSLTMRTAGDDGKDFCYSCGVTLDKKSKQWKVARLMFERPSQRRQSSSSEDRPLICPSCSVLAFASPLKVTDDSVILRLISNQGEDQSKLKIKDYLRMLTNAEFSLSSGQYIVLTSEKTSKGDIASEKLGKIQYSLAKIASIFSLEVMDDFRFILQLQGTEKQLLSRHLIFIKGLMEGYNQSIIVTGKDINLKLGDAIRYVQQELPYLADYTLSKSSSISNYFLLEKVREKYYQTILYDLNQQGDNMATVTLWKRAKLYEDVAALTGLTLAFAQSLESTVKKSKEPEKAEREVSKLIEQVDDPIAFGYYATLGDENKTLVQARLYHNRDNYFIYATTKHFLEEKLGIFDREETDKSENKWLKFYADDLIRAYSYFANPEQENNYAQEKDWKNLTYNLKLSLYTRFPELVRKLSSKGDN